MTSKITLAAVGLAAAIFTGSAQAVLISGAVTLDGTVTADGPNLQSANHITVDPANVSNTVGTFAAEGVTFPSPATFFGDNPFEINPTDFTPGVILYSFGAGGRFQFQLNSITSDQDNLGPDLYIFAGLGSFIDTTNEYEATPADLLVTLSRTGQGQNVTFGFTALSASIDNTSDVPDGGATVALLGSALVGMGALRRKLSK